jgi:hypothetical protein
MPTVVGSVFGSRRVGVAMGMIVTGWAGGYLLVGLEISSWEMARKVWWTVANGIGRSDCGIPSRCIRRRTQHPQSISSRYLLRWYDGIGRCGVSGHCEAED